jgi:NitT/TauT family transport system permease protein
VWTRLLASLGATPSQRFRYHRVPSALPLLLTGCKTAVNFALAAALSAELLGSRYGLGFLIANAGNVLRIDDLYATVVVTALFAGAFYLALEVIDRKVIFWRPEDERR